MVGGRESGTPTFWGRGDPPLSRPSSTGDWSCDPTLVVPRLEDSGRDPCRDPLILFRTVVDGDGRDSEKELLRGTESHFTVNFSDGTKTSRFPFSPPDVATSLFSPVRTVV